MPRSNSSSPETPRPRRSTSRSAQPPPSLDAAADRPASSAAAPGNGNSNPSYDEIAEAAYHRYLRRGAADGQDVDDWVEAERELRSRRTN